MSRFPIALDMEESHVLVAGTGHLAIAKIRLLLSIGINVTALNYSDQKIVDEFKDQITIVPGNFQTSILNDKKLLYITGVKDDELQRLINEAKLRNIPYNHVDDPENSNFTTPAMVQRGPITIAISSDGKAPVLSRNIRKKIEQILPDELGALVNLIHEYRPGVNKIIRRAADKLNFWNSIYSDKSIKQLLKLSTAQKKQTILRLISDHAKHEKSGHVQIVGAGPGDPELLTLKAHRALSEADVIIYDNLISEDILNLSRRDAELIYVGKKRANHFKSQDEINRIIIEFANKGLLVVRLKGGDPSIFGRLAEEINILKNEKISYEIIPGITAASGISASCSIPLTHREHASMVTFSTGFLKNGSSQNWEGLSGENRTIAIYMGINEASNISNELINDGFSNLTPVAIIENGTRQNERRVYGKLEELGKLVLQNNIKSPALLIVGNVVSEAPDYSINTHSEFRKSPLRAI